MKPPVFKSNFSRLNHRGRDSTNIKAFESSNFSGEEMGWEQYSVKYMEKEEWLRSRKKQPSGQSYHFKGIIPGKWITRGTADMCPAKCQNLCRPGTTTMWLLFSLFRNRSHLISASSLYAWCVEGTELPTSSEVFRLY